MLAKEEEQMRRLLRGRGKQVVIRGGGACSELSKLMLQ